MKRVVVLCALLLAVLVSASADIYFWAQGSGLWTPLSFYTPNEGETEVLSSVTAPWGGVMEAHFTISGDTQYFGFRVGMMAKGIGVSLGETAYLWVAPWEWVTISMGRIHDTTLEGEYIGASGFSNQIFRSSDALYRRAGTIDNEWAIFSPFNPNAGEAAMSMTGVSLSFNVLENLFLGAYYNPGLESSAFAGNNGSPGAFQKIQAAAGYNIPAFGRFRLQYLGRDIYIKHDSLKSDQIEAAFSLIKIPGLFLEGGIKIPVQEYKTQTGLVLKNDYSASVHAFYAFDYLELALFFDLRFGGYRIGSGGQKTEYPLNVKAYLVPAWNFGGFQAGGDIGFEYVDSDRGGMDLGAALWVKVPFDSISMFQIGVAAKFPTQFGGVKQGTLINIPILASYQF